MALPEYELKRISDLELNNQIEDSDSLAFDSVEAGDSFRIQFLGLVNRMLAKYVASKDLSNLSEFDLQSFINHLAQPATPDDGSGLVLRTHENETENGLGILSQKLVNSLAHIITDKFANTLTQGEFETLCRLLAGVETREKTGTADGLLTLRDLSNLSEIGKSNLSKIYKKRITQTGDSIIITPEMLGFAIEVVLTGPIRSVVLPTIADADSDKLHQCLLIVKRNKFLIYTDSFTRNGYVVRGDGEAMPPLSDTDKKSDVIEFFCEWDNLTTTPTWNYGYSKIGH